MVPRIESVEDYWIFTDIYDDKYKLVRTDENGMPLRIILISRWDRLRDGDL